MPKDTKLDHEGLEVLDKDTCWELLEGEPVGRIGFGDGTQPVILPVNHAVHDGNIYFRTASGSKLDFARRTPGAPVAFEVDAYDAAERVGWSVLVKGTAHPVTDGVLQERLGRLPLTPWAETASRDEWIEIQPDTITGRRVLPIAKPR